MKITLVIDKEEIKEIVGISLSFVKPLRELKMKEIGQK